MSSLIAELEHAVVRAWPAPDTEVLDGWLLRASAGMSNRGNSVATLSCDPMLPTATRIARVEAWYRARGLAPSFQIGPLHAPQALDAELLRLGYRAHGHGLVQVAGLSVVLASIEESAARARARGVVTCRVARSHDEAWLDLAVGASRFAPHRAHFTGFLARLGARARYALAYADGVPAAACLGVLDGDRLGIYDVICLPALRRRGLTTLLMHALATAAREERVRQLYLLVGRDNAPARMLYQNLGFTTVYSYHYLSLG